MNRLMTQSVLLVCSVFFLPLTASSQDSRPAGQGDPAKKAKPAKPAMQTFADAMKVVLKGLLGKGGTGDDAAKKNQAARQRLFMQGPAGTAFLGSLQKRSKALIAKFGKAKETARGASEPNDKAIQLLEASLGKGDAATEARESLFELGDAAAPIVHAFKKRLDKLRRDWISTKLANGLRSNAIFAGQFSELKLLGDDIQVVMFVMLDPEQPEYAAGLESGLLRALRDVVNKLSKSQHDYLISIADDDFEEDSIRDLAIYLLADTGDKVRFNKKLDAFKSLTKSEGPADQLKGYEGLSDVYYQGRRYKDAAGAWRKYLGLRQDDSDEELAGDRYNACCSMALAGELDEAFKLLELAIKVKSFRNGDNLLIIDHDINPLRKDPRFLKLLKKLEKTRVLERLERIRLNAQKRKAMREKSEKK